MNARTRILTLAAIAIAVGVAAVGAGAAVTIINNNAPAGVHSPTTRAKPSPAPTPTRVALTRFAPTAPVEENFALFNSTATTTIAATPNPGGNNFVAALVAVGFDKSQMQLTADRTSANLVAPSILFSVKVGGSCFIGQFTPSTRAYDSQTVQPISTGACLIGGTAPIH